MVSAFSFSTFAVITAMVVTKLSDKYKWTYLMGLSVASTCLFYCGLILIKKIKILMWINVILLFDFYYVEMIKTMSVIALGLPSSAMTLFFFRIQGVNV